MATPDLVTMVTFFLNSGGAWKYKKCMSLLFVTISNDAFLEILQVLLFNSRDSSIFAFILLVFINSSKKLINLSISYLTIILSMSIFTVCYSLKQM